MGKTLYVLASLPRTGSSLMVDIFNNAGIPAREIYPPPHDSSVECLADELLGVGRDVIAIKPIFQHIINRGLRPDKFLDKSLEQINPSRTIWVYMDRYDKVRQAASYERAELSDEWLTYGKPIYWSGMVREGVTVERLGWMQREQLWWSAYFATHNIDPVRLWYEDWTESPITIAHTANLLLHLTGYHYTPGKMRKKQAGQDIEPQIQNIYNNILKWEG